MDEPWEYDLNFAELRYGAGRGRTGIDEGLEGRTTGTDSVDVSRPEAIPITGSPDVVSTSGPPDVASIKEPDTSFADESSRFEGGKVSAKLYSGGVPDDSALPPCRVPSRLASEVTLLLIPESTRMARRLSGTAP